MRDPVGIQAQDQLARPGDRILANHRKNEATSRSRLRTPTRMLDNSIEVNEPRSRLPAAPFLSPEADIPRFSITSARIRRPNRAVLRWNRCCSNRTSRPAERFS